MESQSASIENQPQNPEFRNNPENFHSCTVTFFLLSTVAQLAENYTGDQGLLVQETLESLCCVLEQDTLSAA